KCRKYRPYRAPRPAPSTANPPKTPGCGPAVSNRRSHQAWRRIDRDRPLPRRWIFHRAPARTRPLRNDRTLPKRTDLQQPQARSFCCQTRKGKTVATMRRLAIQALGIQAGLRFSTGTKCIGNVKIAALLTEEERRGNMTATAGA